MKIATLACLVFVVICEHSLAEMPSAKLTMHFGPNGPAHSDSYYPGDTVFFNLRIGNLTAKSGEVSIDYKYELRDRSDQLITVVATGKADYQPSLGSNCMVLRGSFNIPSTSTESEYSLVLTVTDSLSEQTIQTTTKVKMLKPSSPFLIAVRFANDREGLVPSSGRYVEGDGAYLHFALSGIEFMEDDDLCTCTLRFFEHDEPSKPVGAPIEVSCSAEQAKRSGKLRIPAQFRFSGNRPFTGFARLEMTTSKSKAHQSIDIPLEVRSVE